MRRRHGDDHGCIRAWCGQVRIRRPPARRHAPLLLDAFPGFPLEFRDDPEEQSDCFGLDAHVPSAAEAKRVSGCVVSHPAALIGHFEALPWESRASNPDQSGVIRWKHFRGPEGATLDGISAGLLEIPVGEGLRLHQHEPAEIYYVVSGVGSVVVEETTAAVVPGAFALIPAMAPHKIVNTGDVPLQFIWMFPTDSWHDVRYDYLE